MFGYLVAASSFLAVLSSFVMCLSYFRKTAERNNTNFVVFSPDSMPISFYYYMSSITLLVPLFILMIILIPYFMDSGLNGKNVPNTRSDFLKIFLMSRTEIDNAPGKVRAYRHIIIYMPTIISLVILLLSSLVFPDKLFPYYSIFFSLAIVFLLYSCLYSWKDSPRSAIMSIFWSMFLNIFYFYSYFSLFGFIFSFVDSFSGIRTVTNTMTIILTMIYFSFHVFIATIHSKWRSTIVLMLYTTLAIFMFSIFPGASKLGGLALRNAEIGGGLPARLLIRESDSAARKLTSSAIIGCVIVNTGRFVIVEEFKPESNEDASIAYYCRKLNTTGELSTDKNQKVGLSVYGYGEIINIHPIIIEKLSHN